MNNKVKNIVVTLVFGMILVGLLIINVLKSPIDISKSERRKLKQFPSFSWSEILSTSFMKNFESFSLDQFFCREEFRKIKANFLYNILHQKDNNNIYVINGQVSKFNDKLNEASVEDAGKKFNKLYMQYLNGMNVYYSIIPDKNYFLAKENGYPTIDYDKMVNTLNSSVKFMNYIDIFDCLSIENYYSIDTHWKQETLQNLVKKLGEKMNFSEYIENSYSENLKEPFYGVYYGQSALPLKADKLIYLTNEFINNATVKFLNTETMEMEQSKIYDEKNFNNNDPYDIFLSGPVPLITIENTNCKRDKELIIFRDSFGSSLTPLLVESYSKITIIDLRYIATPMLKNLVNFNKDSDVLLIYSPDVINNSSILKVL